MRKAWKPPSWRPISMCFDFRSKPSLTLLSFAWTLTRPTNYLRQNIVFSYSEMIPVSFSLFLYFSFFCYYTLLLIFTKISLLLLLFFFMKIILIFSRSRMFRNVRSCSGMFRVPGFIDALVAVVSVSVVGVVSVVAVVRVVAVVALVSVATSVSIVAVVGVVLGVVSVVSLIYDLCNLVMTKFDHYISP